MKCSIPKSSSIVVVVVVLFAYHAYAFLPVVQYPGTCTYQKSQSACTFSLLCYLAGGISVEGCGENSTKVTCCVLQRTPNLQQMLTYGKPNEDNIETTTQQNTILSNFSQILQTKPSLNEKSISSSLPLYSTSSSSALASESSTDFNSISFAASRNSIYPNIYPTDSSLPPLSPLTSNSFDLTNHPFSNHKTYRHPNPTNNHLNSQTQQQYHHQQQQQHQTYHNLYFLHHHQQLQQFQKLQQLQQQQQQQKHQQNQHHQYFLNQNNHQYIHHPTNTKNNARSIHFPQFSSESNIPSSHQYSSNYLLNDNYNHNPHNKNFYQNFALNNLNEQNSNIYNIPDLPVPPAIPPSVPTLDSIRSPLSTLNTQLPSSYLNDYIDNPGSIPLSTSLLSSYSPTQTIDYHTYQKHDNFMNPLDTLNPPRVYSPSTSSSSYLNNDDSISVNSSINNKLKDNNLYLPNNQDFSLNTQASLYDNSSPKLSPITSSTIDYDLSANSEETPNNIVNSNKDVRLNSNSKQIEDEYNSNAIRRSRFSSSSLNSIIMDNRSHLKNYIGEEICGKPLNKPTSRIIGGQDAYFGEFPWQVHIKIDKHQCGGALINKDFVITAAHCVYQAPLEQLTIIIGAHDIEEHRFQAEPPQYLEVESVLLHPHFRFSAAHPDRFDVALLKLRKPASYTGSVRPICLPPRQLKLEGWRAVVTGWGKTDTALTNRYGTRLLQKVDVPIIKNNECEKWHQTRGIDLRIFSEMMCAGYEDGQKDACVGDSGGPLVILLNGRWTLAGITSAGFGCAQSRQPGIYHRVSYTVDWILENINNLR